MCLESLGRLEPRSAEFAAAALRLWELMKAVPEDPITTSRERRVLRERGGFPLVVRLVRASEGVARRALFGVLRNAIAGQKHDAAESGQNVASFGAAHGIEWVVEVLRERSSAREDCVDALKLLVNALWEHTPAREIVLRQRKTFSDCGGFPALAAWLVDEADGAREDGEAVGEHIDALRLAVRVLASHRAHRERLQEELVRLGAPEALRRWLGGDG